MTRLLTLAVCLSAIGMGGIVSWTVAAPAADRPAASTQPKIVNDLRVIPQNIPRDFPRKLEDWTSAHHSMFLSHLQDVYDGSQTMGRFVVAGIETEKQKDETVYIVTAEELVQRVGKYQYFVDASFTFSANHARDLAKVKKGDTIRIRGTGLAVEHATIGDTSVRTRVAFGDAEIR